MKAVQIKQYGGPEVLEVVDLPEPEAGAGEVLVRVTAATVNPVDAFTRQGFTQALAPGIGLPVTPGWDLAGEVDGRRVAALLQWFEGTGSGAQAELVAVAESDLATIPDGVDDVTAATVPLNGLTARQALDLLHVEAGDVVLVTGATGAVGGFAVQLASQAGAHVLAVGSYDDDAWLSTLGAKEVLDRAEPDQLVAQVRERHPDGIAAVLDAAPAGGLIGAVRDGGRYVTVIDPVVPAAERGIAPVKVDVQPSGPQLAELLGLVAEGRLKARVAGTLPLEQVREAQEATGLRGKLVLTL